MDEPPTRPNEAADLALIGEATIGIAHALGNALNSLQLQATLLEMQGEPQRTQGIGALLRTCRQMQALLSPLQQAWRQQRQSVGPVDLHAAARDALAGWEGPCVRAELAPQALSVTGTPGGLRRLVERLLLTACARQPAAAGPVLLCTGRDNGRAFLSVTDGGTVPPNLERNDPFHAEAGVFAAATALERQAVQSLLRLFGATLTATRGRTGGQVLRVEWDG